MEVIATILEQVVIMFLLILVGIVAFRIRMINREGVHQMTNILMYFVVPSVILSSFMQEKTPTLLQNLGWAFGLSVFSLALSVAVGYLLIRRKNNVCAAVERFAVIYPNNGFMGIPLISAVLGMESIIFVTAHICISNFMVWTHGITMMKRSRSDSEEKLKIPFKQLITPAMVAFLAGLFFFFTDLKLPSVLSSTMDYINTLNTPLAMIVIGANLAQTNLFSAFRKPRVYYVVLLANLVVPLAALCVYRFLPMIPRELLVNNLLVCACPSAAFTIIFAERYENDVEHATSLFTMSNLATIVTVPLVMFLIEHVLQ